MPAAAGARSKSIHRRGGLVEEDRGGDSRDVGFWRRSRTVSQIAGGCTIMSMYTNSPEEQRKKRLSSGEPCGVEVRRTFGKTSKLREQSTFGKTSKPRERRTFRKQASHANEKQINHSTEADVRHFLFRRRWHFLSRRMYLSTKRNPR